MARLIKRGGCLLLLLLIAAGAYLIGRDYVRRHPQDVPWTELALEHPIGTFTGRKLAALSDDPAQCRALVAEAGASSRPAPPRGGGEQCGYRDGMFLDGDEVRFAPNGVVTSCPVAAALFLWERDVLQLAALRHFGTTVRAVEHAGSYSCRRLYGRDEGEFSEHATADALDVTGFTLADGTRVHVLQDWQGDGARAAFLREVRDGACDLFATVLSPDYNRAHADHFHLDQAERGEMGWRVCR